MLSGAKFGSDFIYLKTDIITIHYKLNITRSTNLIRLLVT